LTSFFAYGLIRFGLERENDGWFGLGLGSHSNLGWCGFGLGLKPLAGWQPGHAVQCRLASPTPLPFGCRLPAATPLPFGCTAAGARRPALRRAELCRPAGGVCLSPPRGCSRAELGSINDRGQRRTRLPSKRAQHRQRYARSKTTSCSHHISVSTALPATTLWCSRRLPSPQ